MSAKREGSHNEQIDRINELNCSFITLFDSYKRHDLEKRFATLLNNTNYRIFEEILKFEYASSEQVANEYTA